MKNSTEIPAELLPEMTPFQAALVRMAVALNKTHGRHIYAGTANPRAVAKRRAKSKVAKQSRKINRP